jgi:cellulase
VVTAGSALTVEMHAQPGDRKCSNPAIGGNHYGPVLIYMAKVSDAKTATSGSFFKVAEDGYTGTTSSWGTEILNANCGKRAFTVPKSLASGDYLVRAEAIALHAGAGNPQPYVSCFQVKVTGGGSATPSGVSFPGAYKLRYVHRSFIERKQRLIIYSDPLFTKAIYDSSFKYVSPGPAIFSG